MREIFYSNIFCKSSQSLFGQKNEQCYWQNMLLLLRAQAIKAHLLRAKWWIAEWPKLSPVPHSFANLWTSFTNEENLFSHTLSSSIRKLLVIGSGFSYSLIAILALINLYSWSTELESTTIPFISWKIQHCSGAKRVSPTILTDQLPCLSINALQLSQWPMLGSHWGCQDKQGERVCCLYAITWLSRWMGMKRRSRFETGAGVTVLCDHW